MKLKKFLYRYASVCSSLALFVALFADGSRSSFIYHQPEVPAGLAKFKK